MTCPGCGGAISRGAKLCRTCRARAIVVGVAQVAHARKPRNAEQNSAYHGKCDTLAICEGPADRATIARRARVHKHAALEWASTVFSRPIESSKDLSYEEMSDVLDWLDGQIALSE